MTSVNSNNRWLSAFCYVSAAVLIPIIFSKNKSKYLARHCQQGFALFFLEIVAYILLQIIDNTLGIIPFIGFLISFVLHLVCFTVVLAISVLGFVKGISGESWQIPLVDDLANKIPIE